MDTRHALFPADLLTVRALFQEYAASLDVDLAFQQFDKELADLPGKYAPPGGGIWLATESSEVAGCIAFRPLFAATCEMKRLFVRSTFRGRGVGKLLVERVLRAAAEAGYKRICLDTLPSMTSAIELYQSLGFEPVAAYCHNPVPGAMFFAKELG